ncbi:MAG: glycosyltransferase [Chlamydiae bacterium]|nr:glycosyltransferase [Chlamydiota bacterium]MBI3267254.1 glycosyltransferase [Chlamydiota bacterium]
MSYSIVIPNYNGSEIIGPLLEQIKTWLAQWPGEVIVVDDASTDESVRFMQEKFPFVKLILHQVNAGFSKTSNDGISAAHFDEILLLNNDTRLLEGKILDLFEPLRKDPNTFVVVPVIVGEKEGKEICESSMELILGEGGFHIRNLSAPDAHFPKKDLSPIPYGTATACAFSKRKFLELGGFESFFAPGYYEDVDLSFKALSKEWKVLIQPSVKFRHFTATTFSKYYCNRMEIFVRNWWLMQWLWLPTWRLASHFLWIPYHMMKCVSMRQFWRIRSFLKALTRIHRVFSRRRKFIPTETLFKRFLK